MPRNWIVSYIVYPNFDISCRTSIFWDMHRDTFSCLGSNFLSRKAFRHNTAGLPDYSWQLYWTRKIASRNWLSLDLQRCWLVQNFSKLSKLCISNYCNLYFTKKFRSTWQKYFTSNGTVDSLKCLLRFSTLYISNNCSLYFTTKFRSTWQKYFTSNGTL